MRSIKKGFLLILLCSIMALWPFSAQATQFTFSLNSGQYGNLDQNHIPTIGSMACGPTSAINSFVFLQNAYPAVYDKSLVPDTNGNGVIDEAEMIAAAQVLAGSTYMDTTLANGTFWSDFTPGIHDYIEDRVPGVTSYSDKYFSDDSGSWDWIYDELVAGEDVEILIQKMPSGTGANHFLTVYGIDFNDSTLSGTLSYIDPWGGTTGAASLWYAGGKLQILYGQGSWIYGGYSESPSGSPPPGIPEPGTLLLLGSGLIGLIAYGRKKLF